MCCCCLQQQRDLYTKVVARGPCCGPRALQHRRATTLHIRPELRQDYGLNLSISISPGEETNQDALSNGERTAQSPTENLSLRIVVYRSVLCRRRSSNLLERSVREGENPVGSSCLRLHEALSQSRVAWECSTNWVVNPI